MHVASDDPEVRRLVTLIADTVLANGGVINPDLVVHHEGASLWLSVPREASPYAVDGLDKPHPDAPPALIIPNELHIPVTNLEWEPSDNRLAYRASTEHLTDPQRTILDAMVALFNAVDKVRIIGQGYAQHSLEDDPELLALIRTARPAWGRPSADDMETTDSPAHTVMRSRLRSEMGEGDEGPLGFFMPMIDMLNHHPYGSRYERTDEGAWLIRVHHPTPTEQIFVRYNKADALGVALGLGYFEPDARFVASVATQFEVEPIGTVHIVGVGTSRRRIPAPRLHRTEDGLRIAGIVLSVESLPALRTLLAMPLRSLQPQMSQAEAAALVETIINRVVRACQDFYTRLAELPVAAGPGVDTELRVLFTAVARRQLELLDDVDSALS